MKSSCNIRSIAVYLGASEGNDPIYRQAAVELACLLAANGITLTFGGSNCGMMKVLADAMLAAKGRAVGVFTRSLPEKLFRNDLTEAVITENLADRKAEMLKRADAVIALPGSVGTFDELFDALARRKLGEISCPIGVLNVKGFFDPLFALLQNSTAAGFSSTYAESLLQSGSTPAELLHKLQR